jgi:hypothetical protein
VDVTTGFAVVLASSRPSQFVITPDRDFRAAVADPALSRVEYVLAPRPDEAGYDDALERAYRDLYATGAGIGSLAREFEGEPPGLTWRLYRVNDATEANSSVSGRAPPS